MIQLNHTKSQFCHNTTIHNIKYASSTFELLKTHLIVSPAEVILNNHFDNDCNCGTSSEETFNNNIIKNKKLNLDMKN